MKKLGKLQVTTLGFGTWAIGGTSYGQVIKSDIFDVMDCYFEAGGNFIDTAESYGDSECLIGEYLSKRNREAVIATKTFAGLDMQSIEEIENNLDESLKKLKIDAVDIYYLHSPPEDEQTMNAAIDKMLSLKKKGKTKTIGASIKGINVTENTVSLCKKYIDTQKIDVIQVVYSILRQKNEEIFEYAKEKNVEIVARTCLESGFLTGKFSVNRTFPEYDHRHRWNDKIYDVLCEVEKLKQTNTQNGWAEDLTGLAARFAFSNPGVTSTIVGAKNREQMQAIVDNYNKPQLDQEAIDYLVREYKLRTEEFNS